MTVFVDMRFFRLVAVGFVVLVAVGCAGESTASPLDGVATVVPDPTVVVVEADVGVPDPTAVVEPTEMPTEAPTVVEEPTLVPAEVSAVDAVTEPTVAPTSVSEPLTFPPTTEPSAMTDEERAVRDVHTRFMTELFNFDERDGRRGVDPALIEEMTTGRQKQTLMDFNAARLEAEDFLIAPGYGTSVLKVAFSEGGAIAVVTDCNTDRARIVDAGGELLAPLEPQDPDLALTRLVLDDGLWKVENFAGGDGQQCVPLP